MDAWSLDPRRVARDVPLGADRAARRSAADDVQVRVVASALNHMDLWVTRGLPKPPLPHVPGCDVAGVVEAVGDGRRRRRRRRRGRRQPGVSPVADIVALGNDSPMGRGFAIYGEHTWGGHADVRGRPGAQRRRPPGRALLGGVRGLPAGHAHRLPDAAPGPAAPPARPCSSSASGRACRAPRWPSPATSAPRSWPRAAARPSASRRWRWARWRRSTRPPSAGTCRPTSWSRASARRRGTSRCGRSSRAAGSSCAAARRAPKVELNLPACSSSSSRSSARRWAATRSSPRSRGWWPAASPCTSTQVVRPRRVPGGAGAPRGRRAARQDRPHPLTPRSQARSTHFACARRRVRNGDGPIHAGTRNRRRTLLWPRSRGGSPIGSRRLVGSPLVTLYVPEEFTRRGSRRPAPLLHQPRRPGVRPRQPARGREGRAVRPLQPQPEEPAPAVPRRVRRRPRHRRRPPIDATVGLERAEELYEKVFFEYGDDSVAQLGGVHLACEQASNLLTKVLEWGRLMSYLEQSTRYIAYDARLGGRYRYYRDPAVLGQPPRHALRRRHGPHVRRLQRGGRHGHRPRPGDRRPSDPATPTSCTARRPGPRRSTPPAGMLPAASLSNVGIYGTGQAFEALLLRMRAHPLPEARAYADLMLDELRKVIPSFLRRVDLPDRGGRWSDYLGDDARRTRRRSSTSCSRGDAGRRRRRRCTLVDFDPDAEDKLLAAICYPHSRPPGDAAARPGAQARRRRADRARRAPTSAIARTAATSRAGRSSASTTASTCCPTTAPSATCSATACSRSSGSALTPDHGYVRPELVDEAGAGRAVRRGDGALGRAVRRPRRARSPSRPPTPWRWPTGCATRCSSTPARRCTCSSCARRRRATRRTGGSPWRCIA